MSDELGYFVRTGANTFTPTMHAQGAWDPQELHFSPLAGLLTHVLLEHAASTPASSFALSRVSFDILGFLALQTCELRVTTLRPGRTIALVEAVATIAGRDAAVARAWFTQVSDTHSIAGGEEIHLASASTSSPWDRGGWTGGFVHSVDARVAKDNGPGSRAVWVRSQVPLIADESVDSLATWMTNIDIANGIAARVNPESWIFPNVDLTVHLHRNPAGAWTGLETSVVFGSTGQGITTTRLHDERGAVGWAQQALTLRPSPGAEA